MIKVLPDIPNIKAQFVHRAMDIPDYLIVPMSDGRIVRYVPEVEHTSLRKIRENLKNMKEMCVGYPPDVGGGTLPGQMTIDDFMEENEK